MRRQNLGSKVYNVLLACVSGDAMTKVLAHHADAAKHQARLLYGPDGWIVMSARAERVAKKKAGEKAGGKGEKYGSTK